MSGHELNGYVIYVVANQMYKFYFSGREKE